MSIKAELLMELQGIFREVFSKDNLQITTETNNNDIDGWTSLTHAVLIDTIEKKLNISFEIHEMLTMHSVEDILQKVSEKKQKNAN
jgi:acyl carrier protein